MSIFNFRKKPPVDRETNYSIRTEPAALAQEFDVNRVYSATLAAESGQVRDLFTLYRDVIICDSHIQGEFSKRKLAVLGDRMTVQAWDKNDLSSKVASDSIEAMIHGCKSWKQACIHLLDSSLWPVSVCEKVYAPTSTGFILLDLVPVPHYLLDYSTGKMMISDVDPVSGSILGTMRHPDPDRYIIHRGHLLTAPDTFGGPMRSILYWWLLGTMSRDWWARFLDRYGSPFMVGHYPSGDEKSRNVLQAAFSWACRVGGLVVNEETKVELVQAAAGNSGDAYDKFLTICQREKSKLILGQTLSAEAQPTGLGSGTSNVQEGVRQDIRQWDASSLADTFRSQLFSQYLSINGVSDTPPTLIWGSISSSEKEAMASILVSLKSAGLDLTDDAMQTISEELGMQLQRSTAVVGNRPFMNAYSAR